MASKYQEIREAWQASRELQVANREACFAFVLGFIESLVRYLEIPREQVRLEPVEFSPSGGTCTVAAASTLDDDGYWSTGLRISIAREVPGTPTLDAKLALRVRRRGEAFELKLYEDGESVQIPEGADPAAAHEFVFTELMHWLKPAH